MQQFETCDVCERIREDCREWWWKKSSSLGPFKICSYCREQISIVPEDLAEDLDICPLCRETGGMGKSDGFQPEGDPKNVRVYDGCDDCRITVTSSDKPAHRMGLGDPPISSEEDVRSYIKCGLEKAGWTVFCEVTADDSSCRADIIATRQDIGTIGIELKYAGDTTVPNAIGEASSQILNKYYGKQFRGKTVNLWVCGVAGDKFPESIHNNKSYDGPGEERYNAGVANSAQRVLNGLGIGFLKIEGKKVEVEFSPTSPELRLPMFHLGYKEMDGFWRYKKYNMKHINSLVEQRVPIN